MRVAVVQMNSAEDKAQNLSTAERLLHAAADRNAELAVLPELSRTDAHLRELGEPPRIEPELPPVREVYDALVLGTRDYVVKNGFTDVLIALSGGIDSSLVAAIASDAIGPDRVLGVLMPSRFSSEGSVSDAEALAANFGIRTLTVPIEAAHSAFLDMLSEPFRGTDLWGSIDPSQADSFSRAGLAAMVWGNLGRIRPYVRYEWHDPNRDKGDDAAADSDLRELQSTIDKAVKRGALHANNGARKKARAAALRRG